MFLNQLLSDNVEHRLILLDSSVSSSRIFVTVRMLPPAQREREDETQGINVDRVRRSQFLRTVEHFRCEPSVGAKRSKCVRIAVDNLSARVVSHVTRYRAAASEIGQFHHQWIDAKQNVVRLYIPMKDVVVVQMIHSLGDLAQDHIPQLIRRQFRIIIFVDDDEIVQRSIAQLGQY